MPLPDPVIRYTVSSGIIEGKQPSERWLSQLQGVFIDPTAYLAALQAGDKLIYYVTNIEPPASEGDLHYGLGVLLPGKVGEEYNLTRGHLHAWRPAAEVYICLSGHGVMLLENERTGECSAVDMVANSAIYVPGYTAHRTVNTGDAPLVYWGVIPSNAGHDYETIEQKNFKQVVICKEGSPVVMDRSAYRKTPAEDAA